MFLRVVLVCLALFSVAYCRSEAGTAGIFQYPFSALGRPIVPIEPSAEPMKRTLMMRLPLSIPNTFY